MRAKPIIGAIIFSIIFICFVATLIFLILSYTDKNLADLNNTLEILFPIYTSISVSIVSGFYRFFFHSPWLVLDLEKSRHYLIEVFDLKASEQTTGVLSRPGEISKARAKYLRISLQNKGKATAKNCRIKLHIHHSDYELVREPSNLYPSGFHQFKKERKPPPFIDIAAGDSQIFDICSMTNITIDRRILRFEDYFNYSRKEAKNNPFLFYRNKVFYIKLFAYSENNEPIESQYKIYLNSSIKDIECRQIDIQEFEWEKLNKKMKRKKNKQTEEKKENKVADIKRQDEKSNLNNEELRIINDNQENFQESGVFDEDLKGDFTTGL